MCNLYAELTSTFVNSKLLQTSITNQPILRFYSLLDPSYAKNNIPIIASVSEHQPTSWSSFYFDLQILTFLFPAGMYYCFKNLTDHNIFIILYGVTSVYFAVRFISRLEIPNPIFRFHHLCVVICHCRVG